MENKLQNRLDTIFKNLTAVKACKRLKEKGYSNLINFTNEIMSIHNKQSELSATERKVMSYIYIQLYKYNETLKENELDNDPEGGCGIVIKTK